MKTALKQIRNHIVTGFIFVLPTLVIVFVISKYWKYLVSFGGKLSKFIFLDTILGPIGDAILFLLLICVVAGFLVKLTVFKTLSNKIDEWLGTIIPSYSTLKGDALKTLASESDEEVVYQTCLVRMGVLWQPAYLIDSKEDGSIVAFVPNVPDVNTGQVLLAGANEWKPSSLDSLALNSILKKLGKGL
jgi:uncharacterized membrane protein